MQSPGWYSKATIRYLLWKNRREFFLFPVPPQYEKYFPYIVGLLRNHRWRRIALRAIRAAIRNSPHLATCDLVSRVVDCLSTEIEEASALLSDLLRTNPSLLDDPLGNQIIKYLARDRFSPAVVNSLAKKGTRFITPRLVDTLVLRLNPAHGLFEEGLVRAVGECCSVNPEVACESVALTLVRTGILSQQQSSETLLKSLKACFDANRQAATETVAIEICKQWEALDCDYVIEGQEAPVSQFVSAARERAAEYGLSGDDAVTAGLMAAAAFRLTTPRNVTPPEWIFHAPEWIFHALDSCLQANPSCCTDHVKRLLRGYTESTKTSVALMAKRAVMVINRLKAEQRKAMLWRCSKCGLGASGDTGITFVPEKCPDCGSESIERSE